MRLKKNDAREASGIENHAGQNLLALSRFGARIRAVFVKALKHYFCLLTFAFLTYEPAQHPQFCCIKSGAI